MYNLMKVFILPLVFFNLISANDIYEDNTSGEVLLMGDAAYGSVVIISTKGLIFNNNHVVEH